MIRSTGYSDVNTGERKIIERHSLNDCMRDNTEALSCQRFELGILR